MVPSKIIQPMVVDLSHHNVVNSFQLAKNWGIRAVIHKASEGTTIVDPTYKTRRTMARDVGFLWGAYHFFRPGNIQRQVEWFLECANPDDHTLMVLDHEDSGCSAADAEMFLRLLEDKIKRKPALYSGNVIKDQLGNQINDYLGSCRLWLAQYGDSPKCQASWDNWWLWQYTGDGIGPKPQVVPGIGEGNNPQAPIDVNSFAGTVGELQESWAGDMSIGPYEPNASEITAFIQSAITLLGYADLAIDGRYGVKTRDAICKYQLDNELQITGLPDQPTIEDVCDEVQKWNVRRRK